MLRSDCSCAKATDDAGARLFQLDRDVNAPTPERCYGFNYSDCMVPTYGYYAYDAVYALAHAAQIVIDEGGSEFEGAAMREALKKVSFQGVTGTVEFMDNGDREVGVGSAILNHDGGEFVPLGSWTRETGFVYGEGRTRDGIVWPSSTGEQPLGMIIIGEGSAQGGFSQRVVLGIVGGAIALVLAIVAVNSMKGRRLRKEKGAAEDETKQEKARAEQEKDRGDLMLIENFKLKNDVAIMQDHNKDEIAMLEDQIQRFTEEMSDAGTGAEGLDKDMARLLIKADEMVDKVVMGAGAFGEVYKSEYRGTAVAVKTMKNVDADNLDRFKNEIMLMGGLRHQNIMTMVGCCWEKDLMALVMEYCEKGMSSDVLKFEGDQLAWDDP